MVASCLFFAGLLTALLGSSSGATLHEKDAQLIRSESRSTNKIVNLSPQGQLISPNEFPPEAKVFVDQERAEQTTHHDTQNENDSGDEYCNQDFPLGLLNKDKCGKRSTMKYSQLDFDQCKWAAKLAHANVEDAKFDIMEGATLWGKVHPRGCFTAPCFSNNETTCYYFNRATVEPEKADGQPVCQRPRYSRGKAKNNKESTCDGGEEYSVIMDEATCRKAANCLGYCQGHEFRETALVVTDYDKFPKGCFIHEDLANFTTPCVYFNEKGNATEFPKAPKGTPICNVTSPTSFQ